MLIVKKFLFLWLLLLGGYGLQAQKLTMTKEVEGPGENIAIAHEVFSVAGLSRMSIIRI